MKLATNVIAFLVVLALASHAVAGSVDDSAALYKERGSEASNTLVSSGVKPLTNIKSKPEVGNVRGRRTTQCTSATYSNAVSLSICRTYVLVRGCSGECRVKHTATLNSAGNPLYTCWCSFL